MEDHLHPEKIFGSINVTRLMSFTFYISIVCQFKIPLSLKKHFSSSSWGFFCLWMVSQIVALVLVLVSNKNIKV